MTKNVNGVRGEDLENFITRIESLEVQKKDISDDISEIYKEAKSSGFNTKIMREIVKIRKRSQDEQYELESLLDIYKNALEMND